VEGRGERGFPISRVVGIKGEGEGKENTYEFGEQFNV